MKPKEFKTKNRSEIRKDLNKLNIDGPLYLSGDSGFFNTVLVIKSSRKFKKENEHNIRENIIDYSKIDTLKEISNNLVIKDKLIDLAIVLYLDKGRYKIQDLDNVAKTVLDGIKKDKKNSKLPYLINDDSQIVRLLLYKLSRTEQKGCNTSNITVSYRLHDPSLEMVLVKP